MRKVWIEAALNGAWSRALQPGIPDTIEAIIADGVACARAGATIIHTHAYDGGGLQTFDWQVYARIIEGIRAQVDVPVYPSYPAFMTTAADTGPSFADATVRFAHIEALAARGLLDFAIIDPPAFAIYEPGFTRAGAALARTAGVKTPIYRFMFCETIAVGFPPRPYALAAHLALLEEEAGLAPWMIAGVCADLRPLIGETVARGGHIRVGLEDAPLRTPLSNLALVEEPCGWCAITAPNPPQSLICARRSASCPETSKPSHQCMIRCKEEQVRLLPRPPIAGVSRYNLRRIAA